MKKVTVILFTSLILNIVGIFIMGKHLVTGPRGSPIISHESKVPLPYSSESDIDHESYSRLVDKLSKAGLPSDVIYSIGSAMIEEHFLPRFLSLQANLPPTPYWRISFALEANALIDPAVRLQLEDFEADQKAAITRLVGNGPDKKFDQMLPYLYRQFGELDINTLERASNIIKDYAGIYAQTVGRAGASLSDMSLAQIESEKRKDLAEILSPQELEQYEMRSGDLARSIRHELSSFRPSENEFRILWSGYKNNGGFEYDSGLRELVALKSELGPTRYADYVQSLDPEYAQVNSVLARLDLPLAVGKDLLAVRNKYKAMAKEIHAGSGNYNARKRELAMLAIETEAAVSELIGSKGVSVYKETAGRWMVILKPVKKGY